MARPIRIEYAGAWYHVRHHSLEAESLFPDAAAKDYFLTIVADLKERFSLDVHVFCLLNDAYHLLVQTRQANLNAAMRHLNSTYTHYYNRRCHRQGAVFQGRYRAILIEKDAYFMDLVSYLHHLPTTDWQTYRWSSYYDYIYKSRYPWLVTEAYFKGLASNETVASMHQHATAEVDTFYSKQRLAPILGRRLFRQQVVRSLHPDQQQVLSSNAKSMLEIVTLAATNFKVTEDSILIAARGRSSSNVARAAAMCLCRDVAGYSLKEIATMFNVGHYASVSATIGRFKKAMAKDGMLTKVFMSLKKQVF